KQPLAGFSRSGPDRFVFAGILENSMLGREALLGFIESRRFCRGVVESLHRADGIILVSVRRGVAQRFDPIACKYGGVLLCASLRGRDHRPPWAVESRDRTAARARRIHDQLPLRRDAIAPAGELGA